MTPAAQRGARVRLYVAVSIDGYIATADGGVAWLDPFNATGEDFGYADFMREIAVVVMGRATYDKALTYGEWPYPQHDSVVVTTRPLLAPVPPRVNAVRGGAREIAMQLRAHANSLGRGDIWLCGGGKLLAEWLDADVVDELDLFTMPVLLGNGIPLWPRRSATASMSAAGLAARWRVTRYHVFDSGVVRVVYGRASS